MEHVTPEDGKRLVDEDGLRLVDCREDYEWDMMRVDGSRLVPLSQYETDPELVSGDGDVVFICAHGNRSVVAADIFEQQWSGRKGYSLDGGIEAWAAKGLPTNFAPPE